MFQRKSLTTGVILLLTMGLAGCYEATSSLEIRGDDMSNVSVHLRNNVAAEREAYVQFTGLDPFAEESLEEQQARGGETRPVDLAAMRLDRFVLCQDGPELGLNYYTGDTRDKSDMSWGRGAWYTFGIKPESSVTCRAQTGGLRVTNDGQYLLIEGAVAVPDIRDYREHLGVTIRWPDGWVMEESSGFQSYDENLLKWSATGGSRLEITARFRPLEPGEIPLERGISGFSELGADALDRLPSGPDVPDFSDGVAAAEAAVANQDVPDGYSLVLQADGTVSLVADPTPTPTSPIPEAVQFAAWTLLGAGIVSGIVVGSLALGRSKSRAKPTS